MIFDQAISLDVTQKGVILQGNTRHGQLTLFLRETVLHGSPGDGKCTLFFYEMLFCFLFPLS